MSVHAVANWFIDKGIKENTPIPHSVVQTLVYFAHGQFLAKYKKPLIKERYVAANTCPAVMDLYDTLALWGSKPITTKVYDIDTLSEYLYRPCLPKVVSDPNIIQILEDVWSEHKHMTIKELLDKARNTTPYSSVNPNTNATITDTSILKYFTEQESTICSYK